MSEELSCLQGALWIFKGPLEGLYAFGGALEAELHEIEQLLQMELEVDLNFHRTLTDQNVLARLFELEEASVAVISGCGGFVVSWAYLPEDFEPDLRWT